MKQRSKSKSFSIQTLILKIVIVWAIVAFVIYPNLNLLVSVFYKNGQFSTEVFGKVFGSARAMKSLVNSFILAFTLVVTVNIVGTLSVLLTEYWDIKGARVLKLAYMSSLIYGGVVLVSGYKYVYGANGLLTKLLVSVFPGMNPNWFVGYGAVVFVMTFSCTQNHMMFLKNAIHGLDYHTIEAAKNMGGVRKQNLLPDRHAGVKAYIFCHHYPDVPYRTGSHVGTSDCRRREFPDHQPHDYYICKIQLFQGGCGISCGSFRNCHDDSVGSVQQD